MSNTETAAPPITVQALRERQCAPGLSFDEHQALEKQIGKLEAKQRHANDQRAGQEAEVRHNAAIARREQFDAALAKASDQADLPTIAAELQSCLEQVVTWTNTMFERNTALRLLVQNTIGTAPDSSDHSPTLLQSIFQYLSNAGMQVRGFGKDRDARTPVDVAVMIQHQARGELRLHGRAKGYDRADWSPVALPVAAE